MTHPTVRRDATHLLFPICVVSGILIAMVPWLHPYATCADWLENWGHLTVQMKGWVMIHKLGMLGFALAAAVGLFFPLLGPRTMASVAGGGGLATGSIFMAMSTMIHATAASTMGKAYLATSDPAQRAVMRSVAEAFQAYDVGVTSGAAFLVSLGCTFITFALWRSGTYSWPVMALLMPIGWVWSAQYQGIFVRVFRISISEYLHWGCFGLWLAATGSLMFLRHWRETNAAPAEAPEPALARAQ